MLRPLPLLLAVLAATPLVLPSAAVADVSGPEIVGFLNAQRAAQGLPAGIAEDPGLSDGCARHNGYGAANNVLEHDETKGRPGYSPQGRDAARVSVLYDSGGPWSAARNPFEEAPIHLHQLLAPRLDRMGAAETGAYGCATTLASRARPAPAADVSYSYPGDGATGWPAAQTAFEAPYTPGEKVGIPAGTRTGPYLYVLFDGPDLSPSSRAQVTRATLSGPDGPVALATVDNTTPGLVGYLPPGAELIPRAPLRPESVYRASVTASVGGSGVAARTFSHRWSFTTGLLPNAVRFSTITRFPDSLTVEGATSDAPGAVLSATGPGRSVSAPLDPGGKATVGFDENGTWRVCLRSGGPGTGFVSAESCRNVSVPELSAFKPAEGLPPDARIAVRVTPAFELTTKLVRRRSRELRVRVSCTLGCGVLASGTVRASGHAVRRRGGKVRVRGRTIQLKSARATLSRAGSRTLRFRISERDARRLKGRGPRTLRLLVRGIDEKDRRTTVTLRARA
ncbi:MAG: hypothetical protein H0V81_06050 [Solirubrobacterales bacterium]|nr:hypothetical protein [Solirubrobacterales bacterium]